MDKSLGEKSMTAFFWAALDKAGSSVVNFIITVILARLLSPEDFGLVAIVMICFELLAGFVDSGFYVSLIREKEVSEADKSTTFIFNILVAAILYAALFFLAPAIASFFEQPMLLWIVRIMGINLIISSFDIIQRAQLMREINFKVQTQVRFIAVAVSGGVAVAMAYGGWGVWSLVAKFGLVSLINTGLLWLISPWRPRFIFNKGSFRRLFGFGYKILIAGLIDRLYQQAYKIVVGKVFSAATLGLYSQAAYFSNLVTHNLFLTLEKITYPVLAKLQEEKERLRRGYRKFIILSSFFILPSMIMMGVLAEPLIHSLLGDKWLLSTPLLQLLCIAGLTYHFNAINLNMLLVLGRSDIGLKLEIIKKACVTVAIAVGIYFGIYGLVAGQVIASYIELFINSYYSKKFLDYAITDQFKDIAVSLKYSLLSAAPAFALGAFIQPALPALVLGAVSGTCCYLMLHYFSHSKEIQLFQETVLRHAAKLIARSS